MVANSVERLRVIKRVLTYTAQEYGWCEASRTSVLGGGDGVVEKVFWLHLPVNDYAWVRLELIRPADWLARQKADVGDEVYVNMPEQGAVGYARVLAVKDCPPRERGPGCRITGIFRHSHGTVMDLKLPGEEHPQGTTLTHPY